MLRCPRTHPAVFTRRPLPPPSLAKIAAAEQLLGVGVDGAEGSPGCGATGMVVGGAQAAATPLPAAAAAGPAGAVGAAQQGVGEGEGGGDMEQQGLVSEAMLWPLVRIQTPEGPIVACVQPGHPLLARLPAGQEEEGRGGPALVGSEGADGVVSLRLGTGVSGQKRAQGAGEPCEGAGGEDGVAA